MEVRGESWLRSTSFTCTAHATRRTHLSVHGSSTASAVASGGAGGLLSPPPRVSSKSNVTLRLTPIPDHEGLEDYLREQYASLSITPRCAPIPPHAVKTTCQVTASVGEPVELALAKAGGAWKVERPQRLIARETLTDSLAKELGEKEKTAVTVDCGVGLFGYSGGESLTCTATRDGAKKPGSITITFNAEGSYKWTASGV